jgi:hypothetical protein
MVGRGRHQYDQIIKKGGPHPDRLPAQLQAHPSINEKMLT